MAIKHKKQLGTSEVEVYTKVVDIAVKKANIDFSYISSVGDTTLSSDRISIDFDNASECNIYSLCYTKLKDIYPDSIDC